MESINIIGLDGTEDRAKDRTKDSSKGYAASSPL
jgi:hypothetical protein